MLKNACITVAVLGFLVLLAPGCGNEAKDEPISTAPPDETLSTATSTVEVEVTPPSTQGIETQHIRAWLFLILVELLGPEEALRELLKVSNPASLEGPARDQALETVTRVKEKLSESLTVINEALPPPSVEYGDDLKAIHSASVRSVERRIAAVELVTQYINSLPPGKVMIVDAATAAHLEGAIVEVEEAGSYVGEALARIRQLLEETR